MAKIKKHKIVKIKKPSAKEMKEMDRSVGFWRRDGGFQISSHYNDEPMDYWKADSIRKAPTDSASTDSIPKKPKAKKKKKRKVLRIN
tara:strand:- start:850 stop:1110 length:261 start_codon:yes stop_codon:yes gene_type:complete